jgi:hypothetical protein
METEFCFGVSQKRKRSSVLECLGNGNGILFRSFLETKTDFRFLVFFVCTYSRTKVEVETRSLSKGSQYIIISLCSSFENIMFCE